MSETGNQLIASRFPDVVVEGVPGGRVTISPVPHALRFACSLVEFLGLVQVFLVCR